MQYHFQQKDDLTLSQCFAKYWQEHASQLKTSKQRMAQSRRAINFFGKNIMIATIGNKELGDYIVHLKRRKLEGGTINRHIANFRKMHRLAKSSWGVDTQDINYGVLRQEEPDCRVRWLTTDESEKLIECAAAHLKNIILFALYTGARLSNILNLKWEDIDFVNRKIAFRVKSKKTGAGKYHVVDIHSALFKMLKGMKGKSGHVFLYENKPIAWINHSFATACKNAGIKDFRFHDLRHTCASWLLQKGTPIDVVKMILGHEDIKTTLKYAHHAKYATLAAMEKTFKRDLYVPGNRGNVTKTAKS